MKPLNRLEQIKQLNLGRFHRTLFQWKVLRLSWDELLAQAIVNGTDTSQPYCCWVWSRKLNSQGYATFQIIDEVTGKERTYRARRFAYEQVFGVKLTSDDWLIGYVCDNPDCVNPFHATKTTRTGWYVDDAKANMEKMRLRILAKDKLHSK